jgi:dCMP deaminase
MAKIKYSLIVYIPAIHRGYLEFFKKLSRKADEIWIVSQELVDKLVRFKEIRAIDPNLIAEMVKSLNIFKSVKVLEIKNLGELKRKQIILPDEVVSHALIDKYFKSKKVKFESIFLRWDEKNVLSSSKINSDRISKNAHDQKMMKLAVTESKKSSDWWRRIGAVIEKDGRIIMTAHNQHEPTEQTPYIVGDPRDMVDPGTHNLLYSSIHAEQLMISQAASKGLNLSGSKLYINVFPCPECTKLVAHAGIKTCYFKTGSAWLNSEEVIRAFGIKIIKIED